MSEKRISDIRKEAGLDQITVGERIQEARKKAGLTQVQLAERSGVAAISIHQYESGKRKPRLEQIKKIADALGIDINLLVFTKRSAVFDSAPPADQAREHIPLEEFSQLLVALGFIHEGEDLSSDDLAFLEHIIGQLNLWFSSRKKWSQGEM